MYPILFKFGILNIYSYGLMLAIAFIIAASLVESEARRQKIASEKMINFLTGLLIAGILGARFFYIIQNLNFYIQYPGQILMLHKGGLSFYGGFILATVFAVISLKRKHLPILKILDLICPYLALAQAIGRIGCFLNGCCYGKPTDFFLAVHFPGENITRHPVQIYSSLILLAIFIILRTYQAKTRKADRFLGQTFLLYCLIYSSARFFMEYLRGDNLPFWLNLTLHQFIGLGIFTISLVVWWKKRRHLTMFAIAAGERRKMAES